MAAEFLLVSTIIGVLSGIIASLVFFHLLTRIRPKLQISDKIAKKKSSGTSEVAYKIKVINKTHHPIINVKAQLHLVTPVVVPGGILLKTREIPLKRNEILCIEKFDSNDEQAKYAFRFVTYENIDDIWKEDEKSFLRFRVIATDSFSGFTKVFVKDYQRLSTFYEFKCLTP